MQRFDGGYDRRDARRQVLLVATIGLVLSTLFIAGWFHRSLAIPSGDTWQRGRLLSDSYDPPTRPVELYHNQGDGQLFVHQAQDPFVRHPEGIRGSRHEQAYRLQRPLYGWLGWLASRGRPDAVGWGLIALTVTSVAVLGGIVAAACRALGASALWGVTTYVAPGILENLLRCGPEALGTALVTAGVVLWIRRRPQPWAAVACFAVAGLCRESLLLVPLTLLSSSGGTVGHRAASDAGSRRWPDRRWQ